MIVMHNIIRHLKAAIVIDLFLFFVLVLCTHARPSHVDHEGQSASTLGHAPSLQQAYGCLTKVPSPSKLG
jgi:hypothetical protein